MQTNKKEVLENYLKTVAEYFSEEIKSMYEIESEEKRNLSIDVLFG